LSKLALHLLDWVLTGKAAPRHPDLRLTGDRIVDGLIESAAPKD
jgi:hypothetical protein